MSSSNHSNHASNHASSTKASHRTSPIEATARVAKKLLSELSAELNLDTAGRPPSRAELVVASRVDPEALTIASRIVALDPHKFDDFDAGALATAGEYVQAMLPVLDEAELLVNALRASVYSKRLPASNQALALHALATKLAEKVDRAAKKRPVAAKESAAKSFAKQKAKQLAKAEAKVAKLKSEAGVSASPSVTVSNPSNTR